MSTTPTAPLSGHGPAAPAANFNASPRPTSTSTVKTETYVPNERVLCFHGPLIYEAKVMKARVFEDNNVVVPTVGPHYLVHYKGWKQT